MTLYNLAVVGRVRQGSGLITGDPQFGDVILLVNQDNVLVHSATYLADDVVFTKNGGIFTSSRGPI